MKNNKLIIIGLLIVATTFSACSNKKQTDSAEHKDDFVAMYTDNTETIDKNKAYKDVKEKDTEKDDNEVDVDEDNTYLYDDTTSANSETDEEDNNDSEYYKDYPDVQNIVHNCVYVFDGATLTDLNLSDISDEDDSLLGKEASRAVKYILNDIIEFSGAKKGDTELLDEKPFRGGKIYYIRSNFDYYMLIDTKDETAAYKDETGWIIKKYEPEKIGEDDPDEKN